MPSGPGWYRENGSGDRIWHGRLCIEFTADGGLSPAELRVIRLLLKGYTTGEIAGLCSRSIKTISAQKNSALRRLGVWNDATLLPALLLQGMVRLYTGPEHAALPDAAPPASLVPGQQG
ncbi:TPA: LuxR family transcriptional regulator [Salmonella enterica]|nr:LuxR family transcriptional regulator [Salmonella enterica]